MAYKRVMLKLSGESLAGKQGFGISDEQVKSYASLIKRIHELGVELAIVVGGGNFWRGRTNPQMNRVTADQIGMLATTMNAMA
ncbi:MAG: UMP kinase, partial [Clostridiaceae bacterium]|nr:UMP kinase [Clostridiaceae bacterium]